VAGPKCEQKRTIDSSIYNTITGETTWNRPKELTTDSGDWCWIEDEADVFIPARLKSKYTAVGLISLP